VEITEFKIITINYGGKGFVTDLNIKFDKGETIKINLKPDNWVPDKRTGTLWPKFGSKAFTLFKSLLDLNIKLKVYFLKNFISTTPNIVGKICEFESE
jgi:hypothetical protein